MRSAPSWLPSLNGHASDQRPRRPREVGPWPRSHSSLEVKPSLVFPDTRGQEYPGHPVPAKQGQAAHLALSLNILRPHCAKV